MLSSLLSFLNSDGFSAFSIILGVLSNIATLVLTLYTFYLTTLSKNISLIGSSLNHSCFNGTKITFTVKNRTLHSISVEGIFIMRQLDSKFYLVHLDNFDSPHSIDSWKIENLSTSTFTSIPNWTLKDADGHLNYNALMKNSILGIKSGKDIIWIASKRHKILRLKAKKAYTEKNYQELTVHRFKFDDKVISPNVTCAITICLKNGNKQNTYMTVLGAIPLAAEDNDNSLLFDKPILGRPSIEDVGHTEYSIGQRISRQLNIPHNDIRVQMLHDNYPFAEEIGLYHKPFT